MRLAKRARVWGGTEEPRMLRTACRMDFLASFLLTCRAPFASMRPPNTPPAAPMMASSRIASGA
jgi:hypothetical protein